MIRSYLHFARRNYSFLAFGVLLMILSSPGQTFFISIFVDDFRSYFSLTDGEVGAIFAAATFLSAIVLPHLGQQIDRIDLPKYTAGVGALLCVGCLMIGLSPAIAILLWAGVFLLRLGGQGLMIHTSMTAMVRAFPEDSGKAIAVVGLFYSASLVLVPPSVVWALHLFGWKLTWLGTAVVVFLGAFGASALVKQFTSKSIDAPSTDHDHKSQSTNPSIGLMIVALPSMLAVSFIFTGLLFHQAELANEKGWPLTWLASCFSAFAISQSATSFIAGPIVDRFGAVRVLPVFLLPLLLSLGLIVTFNSIWIAPFYMALIGVSAAIDIKLGTILWRDLFGASRLGYIRSRFESARIIVTGSAPLVVGFLLDLGVPLTRQAAIYAGYVFCASGLSLFLARYVSRRI